MTNPICMYYQRFCPFTLKACLVALMLFTFGSGYAFEPPTKNVDSAYNSLLVDFLKAQSLANPVAQCDNEDYPIFGADIKVYNLGPNVNSPYSDYNPVLDKKETFLLFTSRRQVDTSEPKDIDGQYYEKMFVSRKDEGVFGDAHPITQDDSIFGRLPSSERHESLIFLSYSEDLLITYTNEKLFYSNRIGEFYTEPVEFPKVINKGKWKRHASITEDGRKLYFTTESKSTINNNLNLDIWEIERNDDGSWKRPHKLNDMINSPYNEDSPEISPDGRFLFFSSNRSGGVGGYDVYMSEKIDGKWTDPKNLCEPINTAGDDIYFKLSRSGNYAYYSSNSLGGEGNMDIYKVILDVPSIATCGSYAYGKRNITFTSPFSMDFYGGGKEFFWAFGDGQSGVGEEVNHQYATDGDYNVVLYVRDRRSKRVINTVFSKKVRVDTENSAVEILGPDTVEVGNEILFDGKASYVDNTPASAFYWKVDGQLVSREPIINYEFTGVGKHKIELEVGVLDERIMELSSSCIAREVEVVTPFVYQRTVGADEASDGFSFSPLVPDRVLYELGVEQEDNKLNLQNDYVKTWENESKIFNVFENDRTPGVSLDRIVFSSNAQYGSVKVVNAPFGQIEYTPSATFSGYDKFTYSAKAKDGRVSTATVVVSVMKKDAQMENQNVTNDIVKLAKKEAATIFPLQNDEHEYGEKQRIVALSKPGDGMVQKVGLKGLVEYTPSSSFQGSDAFTYTVQDGKGNMNTASVIIKMTETTSQDLFANPDYVEIVKDERTRIKVLANDVIKGSAQIVDISSASHGACKLINPMTGDVYYGPDAGFVGTDAFTYTLESSNGERSTTSVTVIVKNAVNLDRPLTVETYQYNSINIFVFDEMNIPSSYEVYGAPRAQHGNAEIVDSRKGILTYKPEGDYVGFDLFYVDIKNGQEKLKIGMVIKVLEQSGLISKYGVANHSMSINVNEKSIIDPFFEYQKLSKDARVMRLSANGNAASLQSDNKVAFDYTQLNQEQFAIAYQIENEGRLSGSALLINPVDELGIPLITKMVLTPDMTKTRVNDPVSVMPLLNDRHLKAQSIRIKSVSEPLNGTIVFNDKEGSVLYVPNLDFKGTDAFTYTAVDEDGTEATTAVNIVVLSQVEYALENEGYNPKLKAFNYVTLEPDKQFMNPEKVVDATNGLFGTVEVANEYTGELKYVPNKGFAGEDRFSFTMLHEDGSFTNHPVLAVVEERNDFIEGKRTDPSRHDLYNDEVIFYYPLINKNHPQGKEMKIVSVSGEQGGVANIINETAFSYQPLNKYSGPDKLTFTLMDDNGKLQKNHVYIDVVGKELRKDLPSLSYKTPVNIPLKISLGETAEGYKYVDHTKPNAGSVKLLSKSNLVFEYAASADDKNDVFVVALQSREGAPSYLNVSIEVLPAIDLEMARASYKDYDYKLLKSNDDKFLAVAEPDKGKMKFDKATNTFTYEPYANVKGYDRIDYLVKNDTGTASKHLNIFHMDYSKLNPDQNMFVKVNAADDDKLLIYTFSNLLDQNTGIYIDKSKGADEGEIEVLNAELGILQYTPKNGVPKDEFTIIMKNADKEKQEVTFLVDVKKQKNPEGSQKVIALAAAQNLKSFNYQLIDRLEEEKLKFLGVSDSDYGDIDVLDFNNGLFTYLPKDGFEGVEYLLVEVEDENGLRYTIPVQITVQKQEEISAKNLTYENVASVEANRNSYHAVLGQNADDANLISVSNAKAGKVRILDATSGIVEYTPYKGFVGEDSYTFEYATLGGEVYQKEMHVFVRDESAGLISMGEIKRQSEAIAPKVTNVSEDIASATEQSQAEYVPSEGEIAAVQRAQQTKQSPTPTKTAGVQDTDKAVVSEVENETASLSLAAEAKAEEEAAAQQAAQAANEQEKQRRLEAEREAQALAESKAQAQAQKQEEEAKRIAAKEAEADRKAQELALAKAQEAAQQKAQAQAKTEPGEKETVVFRNILFDFDKSDLRPLSESELNKVYSYLQSNPEKVLQLDGHADWIGTVEYNLALSERRAKRAYEFLKEKGVSDERMVYQYYGEAVPVAPNANPDGSDNPTGRQLNRRCEFNIKTEGTADIIMKF